MSNNRMEQFSVKLLRETDAAIHVDHGAGKCWLPKSQLDYTTGDADEGDIIEVEMPQWLAEEKEPC